MTAPGRHKDQTPAARLDRDKENTMNYQGFDTDPSDMRGPGSDASGPTRENGKATKAVASLESAQILRAVLPEGLPLARAAQDADPKLVHASGITLRAMAPTEVPETLRYSLHLSAFGQLLIASCPAGVCHVTFAKTQHSALQELSETFPRAHLQQAEDPLHLKVLALVNGAPVQGAKIVLNMPGTAFQHRVWAALLHIPRGTLATYGQIARFIGQPQSARAVGTAIGANRAAFLVPCHRVVRRSGEIGGFMWGVERKIALIAAEIGGAQE
jgi:O-6-methylguanine DNA methyltransferase